MKPHLKSISRREILKKGIIGGMAVSILPLSGMVYNSVPAFAFQTDSDCESFKKNHKKLRELAQKYGSEFSGIHAEF